MNTTVSLGTGIWAKDGLVGGFYFTVHGKKMLQIPAITFQALCA